MADVTPKTHFLQSVRVDKGSYAALLAEGVDNAFDAGARTVQATLDSSGVTLRDDGVGITRDRALAIVTLGDHQSMPTTMLGAFGIGLKYHAVSAGDRLEVESTSADGSMALYADWSEIIDSGKWWIPDPVWRSVRSAITGTKIHIGTLRWPAPTTKDLANTADKLAQLFYPALAARCAILFNRTPLPILEEPRMIDIVEGTVQLPTGKGARVRGGIMTQPSSLYQVHVSYRHRVIKPQSTFGCGEFTGTRKLFARVELTGSWTLARFKDNVVDDDIDELETRVHEILLPVLEKCHSAQMSLQIESMTAMVNDLLPADLVAARPKKQRDGDQRSGDKRGRGNGTAKSSDERSTTGPAKTPKPRPRLLITFDRPLVDECGYGRFEPGKPDRVILATDNPHIAALLDVRDKDFGAKSLVAIALLIYYHEKRDPTLPFESIGLQAWNTTKRQNIGDDVTAIR